MSTASNTPTVPNGGSAPIGVVRWVEGEPHEIGKEREVVRECRRCFAGPPALSEVYIVSPAGVAHQSDWDGTGHTACGHDATRLEWWWRL